MVFYGYLHYKLNGKQWYWQTICKPWFLRVGWLDISFIAPSQPLNNSIGQPEMCLAISDKVSGFSAGTMESYCQKPMILNCDLKEMNKSTALGCCFPTKSSKSSNSSFMGILMIFLGSTLTYQRKGKITMRFCVSSVNSVARWTQISVIQLLTFLCLRLFVTFHHLGYHIFYFFQPRTGQANLSLENFQQTLTVTPTYNQVTRTFQRLPQNSHTTLHQKLVKVELEKYTILLEA